MKGDSTTEQERVRSQYVFRIREKRDRFNYEGT